MTKKEMIIHVRGRNNENETKYYERRLTKKTIEEAYRISTTESRSKAKRYLAESLRIKDRRLYWTRKLEEDVIWENNTRKRQEVLGC